MLRNKKGLSLPELLAVVVIMGIIAAIAIPAVGTIIDNSKKDAHVANALRLIEAAELYEANNGTVTDGGALDSTDLGTYISGLTGYSEGAVTTPATDNGYYLIKDAGGWVIGILKTDDATPVIVFTGTDGTAANGITKEQLQDAKAARLLVNDSSI